MGAVAEAIVGAKKGAYKMPIKRGLQIDLYSDGFTDMQNDDGERYDEQRTKEFFGDQLFKTDVYSAEKTIEKAKNNVHRLSVLINSITVAAFKSLKKHKAYI